MTPAVVVAEPAERPLRSRPGLLAVMAGLLASVPLVVAIVVLRWRPWYPVLDLAMTEFRVRDVGGRHTPLIGLPGRIGRFPDQGSHPGPASFYLLAPFYRLGGASAWGMELGSVVLNVSALVGTVVVMARRRSIYLVVVGAAVAAVLVRGYGLSLLTHPWNPYFPLLLWVLVLVASWAVLCGDRMLAVVVVVVGSIVAQTHVPYLLLAVAQCTLVLGWLAVSAARSTGDDRRADLRALGVAVGAGVLVWLPALADQVRRDPGNIRMLLDHFTTPDEDPIGLGAGVRLFLRHLDAPAAMTGLFMRSANFLHLSSEPDGQVVGGLVTLALFVGSFVVAWRLRHAALVRLHVVVAVALVVGLASMVRIFGKVWYYLTLWAWGTLTLLVVAVLWTAVAGVRARSTPSDGGRFTRVSAWAAAAVAAVLTVASTVAAFSLQVPEPNLSDGLGEVIGPTVEAIEEGVGGTVGRDGTYVVFWQDSVFIGAQGYGLVNELERRGFDVGVHPTWRVPVTHQRVLARDQIDAEIHLVSGQFIDEWRAKPGHVEVVEVDVRTPEERARFEELRDDVIAGLREEGLDELVPVVGGNLFGASLDPRLSDRLREDMSEMIELGEPVAIFIAPPGSTS